MDVHLKTTLLVCLLSMVAGCYAVCTNNITWVSVPEERYDRNYSSIVDVGKRPLGFMMATVPYDQPDVPNPCIHVKDTLNKRVEIMVQTVPENRICMRDQNGGYPVCGLGSIQACREARATSLNFEFFCDDACPEDDIDFWYRFTLSAEGMNPDMWCDERDGAEFPESLMPVPADFVPPTVLIPGNDSGGSTCCPVSAVLLLLLVAATALC